MNEDLSINGYLVVSRVQDGYAGPDRNPWEALGEAFWAKTLPSELHELYSEMGSRRGLWWHTCPGQEQAERLLAYSREISPVHAPELELIGIDSPYLDALGAPSMPAGKSTPLGFDVISIGEWSLLRALNKLDAEEGVTARSLTNDHGLLPSASALSLVLELYLKATDRDLVEEIARPSEESIEAVCVFRPDAAG